MRLGLMIGYSGARFDLPLATIQEADRLGYYAVWTAEAYGSDSVTPLAWIGAHTSTIHLGTAIMQIFMLWRAFWQRQIRQRLHIIFA